MSLIDENMITPNKKVLLLATNSITIKCTCTGKISWYNEDNMEDEIGNGSDITITNTGQCHEGYTSYIVCKGTHLIKGFCYARVLVEKIRKNVGTVIASSHNCIRKLWN